MEKLNNWIKRHKKLYFSFLAIALLLVIAAIASSGGSGKNGNTPTKKASYQAWLWAGQNNISNTLPASGWNSNTGWDTAAQAIADQQSTSTDTVAPAVIQESSSQLKVLVNIENTGNETGTPNCKIQASSSTGADFESGADIGMDELSTTKPITPGNYANVTDTFTITNQGAANIKEVRVNCT